MHYHYHHGSFNLDGSLCEINLSAETVCMYNVYLYMSAFITSNVLFATNILKDYFHECSYSYILLLDYIRTAVKYTNVFSPLQETYEEYTQTLQN